MLDIEGTGKLLNVGGTGSSVINVNNTSAVNPLEIHSANSQGLLLYTHSNTNFRGPALGFYRSYGTQSAPTGITGSSQLGYINFDGVDTGGSGTYSEGAQIQAQTCAAWSTSTHSTVLSFQTVPAQSTAATQVFRMGSNTDCGDGNANASYINFVVGSGYVLGFSSSNGDGAANAGFSKLAPDVVALGNGTNADFSGTLITSQIGIGTTAPSTTLQVAGASSTIRIGAGPMPGCLELMDSSGNGVINYITATGGVLSATTTKPSACQ